MKLRVLEYKAPPYDYHLCQDEDGAIYRIDLMVDGGLNKVKFDIIPDEIVGKTVQISRMHGYIHIGHEVELVEDEND